MDAAIVSKAQSNLRSKVSRQWSALTDADLRELFANFPAMWNEAMFSALSTQLVELLLRRYGFSRFEIELQLTVLLNGIEADIAHVNIPTASSAGGITASIFERRTLDTFDVV